MEPTKTYNLGVGYLTNLFNNRVTNKQYLCFIESCNICEDSLCFGFAFCAHQRANEVNPSPRTLCLYLEYLATHMQSPTVVLNYLSIVRLLHHALGMEPIALDSYEVRMMTRAIPITMRHQVNPKLPISVQLLSKLIVVSQPLGAAGAICVPSSCHSMASSVSLIWLPQVQLSLIPSVIPVAVI